MKRHTSKDDLQTLCERQNWHCAKCPAHIEAGTVFHIDHIQPLSRGGSDTLDNKQLLCVPCHSAKTFHPRSKASTIGSDIFEAAKTKRLANPKPSRHPMPKTSRKIPSRPWPKSKTKLSG